MSFQDIMLKMLPSLESGKYKPYVNGGGDLAVLNDFKLPIRSDYDDVRTKVDKKTGRTYRYIHGGVDIYYYKIENGTPEFLGPIDPGQPENKHPRVYAPVTGRVININKKWGSVSILDANGYVHTIMHMQDINPILSDNPSKPTIINESVARGSPIKRPSSREKYIPWQ